MTEDFDINITDDTSREGVRFNRRTVGDGKAVYSLTIGIREYRVTANVGDGEGDIVAGLIRIFGAGLGKTVQ